MQQLTRSTHIEAPPEEVWAILEDVRLLPSLSSSTVQVQAPERLEREGQEFTQTVTLGGRSFTSTWTVREIQPGRRLVIEGSVLPGTKYRMTERLEQVSGGTTLDLVMDYKLPFGPLGRLAGKLGAERRAAEEAAHVVQGVRELAESRQQAARTEEREPR